MEWQGSRIKYWNLRYEINNKKQIIKIEENIISSLIKKDPIDEKNAIFEIKGAAGGEEANIFVGDLYEMYQKYFSKKNIKTLI